ncbi:MAG: uL15 family ribosomal protein [Candidatus Vidania fulgoroideorum]
MFYLKIKKRKRIGRGNSSKKGNTCGRGIKGQKSRSGYSKKQFFLGGQTAFNILFPKFGFKKTKKKKEKKIKNTNTEIKYFFKKKYSKNFKKNKEFKGGFCI